MSGENWRVDRTPPPPHPFAHSIANDQWILISGAVGFAPDFSLPESAGEQARNALAEIGRRLEGQGSSWAEVVWFKPYVTDGADIPAVDDAIREVLSSTPPAAGAMTIVGLVDPSLKVEFEVWAYRGAKLTLAE